MFQTKADTSEYYDFKLVSDNVSSKKLGDFLEVSIDFSNVVTNSVGNVQETEVVLPNITLTGLDNMFIKDGINNGEVNTAMIYTIETGHTFNVWPVSGYTENIDYNIASFANMKKLNGGFYQGFYKLHSYPVEFFNAALSKGWTANITLFHDPTHPENTLNSIYPNNEGFVFYMGTRAENKYNDITVVELERIKEDYSIDFGLIKTTLYTHGGEFHNEDGTPYIGKYNYNEGQYWTGYEKTDISLRLIKEYNYEDVINNAFGIRIHPDGRVGYRTITSKECEDVILTGMTSGGTVEYLWYNVYDCKTDSNRQVLVTPKYKVVEQYSKLPVFNDKVGKYVNLMIIFERYFSVTSLCELKYSDYRKGNLKIFINGIKVLQAENVDEAFCRELDTVKELQEAVPYILSIGGGTQGLYEAVYLDPNKTVDGVLEKYFAGTYTGSLKSFSFYSTPANVAMIREKTTQVLNSLSIPITFGGRKIITY